MSVAASDLIRNGAASRPTDDTSTSGGAEDTAARPDLSLMSQNETIDLVSDGADSRNATLRGRNPAGSIVTETVTLNGTTVVTSSNTYERLLSVTLSASDASRTVTVSGSTSGDTLAAIDPGYTVSYIFFREAASQGGSSISRWEKFFWRNSDPNTDLQNAQVKLTADPAAVITIALANSKDDAESVTDRTTQPTSVSSFVDDGTALSVPGSTLESQSAIGVWPEQTLSAGHAPVRDTFTTEISGETT